MPTFNPYEAPQSAFAAQAEDDRNGPWRDGADLVVRHDARLPQRCIKCNAPSGALKRRRYYWHNGGYYLLILINLLVYALVAVLVRKKTHLSAGLCEQHGRRRTLGLSLATGLFLIATGIFVAALVRGGGPELFALAVVALLASIVAGMSLARLVHPKRISERYARFGGCGRAFLDTLPRFRGLDG
ncbi:hypothetical protein K4L06_08190 [Lysobacter sp. BMK333-48F3]|uniref:hypothetical protein n=1 Tax=Lysobacter sp. BMK333-48F3 TaxID=2867962 RepID=UPI001C8C5B27|nr:hypothetical protein [Lysobacter sp. BMK333-48F3]MBX9401292.1 hypothetical protein [Lysobacter sp. BMK333-48F3]